MAQTKSSPSKVSARGIRSTAAFGKPRARTAVEVSGIGPSVKCGVPNVVCRVWARPIGIATGLVWGTPIALKGFRVATKPIRSSLVFGKPKASTKTRVSTLGISSTLVFGLHAALTESFAMSTVNPTGLASTLAFGTGKAVVKAHATGIASTAVLGSPRAGAPSTFKSAPGQPTAASLSTASTSQSAALVASHGPATAT